MNKQEQNRFDKLRDEAKKEIGAFILEKLSYPDLFLMLREDKELRKLIRAIAKSSKAEVPEDTQIPPENTVDDEEIPEKSSSTVKNISTPLGLSLPEWDPLRKTLSPELVLLAQVREDAEMAADWLGEAADDEGRQLVRLIARAAQWDSILDLWERLSARCKARQCAALPEELAILDACLKIHNLIWHSRQADFTHATIGASYDYRQHQRGTSTGETIEAEWLPGLTNASGTTQKPPLVAT